MTTAQKIAQRNSTEEELIAWLEAKDPEELRQFLTSPWVASLLSDEAIRELYEKIRQQEVSPFAGAAEGYNIEIGMD